MLLKLYEYKEKYENEVAEHEIAIAEHEKAIKERQEAMMLSKAKVSVVCDMIADAEEKETTETQPTTDETY